MAYVLDNNDQNKISFAKNNDYKVDITFSQWDGSNSKTILAEDFDLTNVSKQHDVINAVFCTSPASDPDTDFHLVLFIKEVTKASTTQLNKTIQIPLKRNDVIRRMTVRYFTGDDDIPNPDQVTCAKYYSVLQDLEEEQDDDKIIPDTHNGGIIIKN